MPKIYLHVGFPKTATTSFQATCSKNYQKLKNLGYIYPQFERYDFSSNILENHNTPLYTIFSKDPSSFIENVVHGVSNITFAKDYYMQILNKCLDGGKDLIMSSEALSFLHEDELFEMVSFFEKKGYKVIAFAGVRSPYSYHCSTVQQAVKMGIIDKITDFNTQRHFINKFRKIFGEKFVFLNFKEMCSYNTGPVGFFLNFIGVDEKNFDIVKSNIGYSNEAVRAQLLLNKRNPKIINGKVNSFFYKVEDGISKNKFYLTEGEYAQISDECEKENIYFNEVLGSSFCDKEIKFSEEVSFDDMIRACPDILGVHIPDDYADSLRDGAIALESNNIEQAYQLMSLAYRVRPQGAFIQSRLKDLEYKMQVN